MAHVVTQPCIGVMDKSCVEQCPVEAFYQGPDQVFINPEECIDCGACVAVCPVNAIYATDDVPADQKSFIDKAVQAFAAGGLEKAQPKKK